MRIFHYDFISYRIDALLRCVCTVQCRFNTSCRMRTTLKRLSVTYTALDLLLSISTSWLCWFSGLYSYIFCYLDFVLFSVEYYDSSATYLADIVLVI